MFHIRAQHVQCVYAGFKPPARLQQVALVVVRELQRPFLRRSNPHKLNGNVAITSVGEGLIMVDSYAIHSLSGDFCVVASLLLGGGLVVAL